MSRALIADVSGLTVAKIGLCSATFQPDSTAIAPCSTEVGPLSTDLVLVCPHLG